MKLTISKINQKYNYKTTGTLMFAKISEKHSKNSISNIIETVNESKSLEEPWKNSKITSILKNSFGDNSYTTVIFTFKP